MTDTFDVEYFVYTMGITDLEESDIAVVKGLVRRIAKSQAVRERFESIYEEAKAGKEYAVQVFNKSRNALAAFGFDTKSDDLWNDIRSKIGEDEWNAAISEGFSAGKVPPTLKSLPPVQRVVTHMMKHHETGDAAHLQEAELIENNPSGNSGSMPLVREVILSELQKALPNGLKASQIQDFILREYSRDLHEKTVGMTLYRLSLQGLVSRDRRTWFFVQQPAETKNPGVDAPGQTSIFDQEGGTDGVSHPTHNT